MTDNDVRRQIDQLLCKNFDAADVTASPAVIDLDIAVLAPTDMIERSRRSTGGSDEAREFDRAMRALIRVPKYEVQKEERASGNAKSAPQKKGK
jgi:hypothetical protein